MIESNNWECSLIDTPIGNGPRVEVVHEFSELEKYISKIPGIVNVQGVNEMDNTWTLHFDIDLGHEFSSKVKSKIEMVIHGMKNIDKCPLEIPFVPIDFHNEDSLHYIISVTDVKFSPAMFLKFINEKFPMMVSAE